jgi:hypothetical protein
MRSAVNRGMLSPSADVTKPVGFRVLAGFSLALILYLTEHEPETLQPSFMRTMTNLYHESGRYTLLRSHSSSSVWCVSPSSQHSLRRCVWGCVYADHLCTYISLACRFSSQPPADQLLAVGGVHVHHALRGQLLSGALDGESSGADHRPEVVLRTVVCCTCMGKAINRRNGRLCTQCMGKVEEKKKGVGWR